MKRPSARLESATLGRGGGDGGDGGDGSGADGDGGRLRLRSARPATVGQPVLQLAAYSLLPRTLAPSAPSTPLPGQLSYLVAVSTPLDAATAQTAPLPAAAAAAEVRKGWTELEDEEILRRHIPHATHHTRHAPRATRPRLSPSASPTP